MILAPSTAPPSDCTPLWWILRPTGRPWAPWTRISSSRSIIIVILIATIIAIIVVVVLLLLLLIMIIITIVIMIVVIMIIILTITGLQGRRRPGVPRDAALELCAPRPQGRGPDAAPGRRRRLPRPHPHARLRVRLPPPVRLMNEARPEVVARPLWVLGASLRFEQEEARFFGRRPPPVWLSRSTLMYVCMYVCM